MPRVERNIIWAILGILVFTNLGMLAGYNSMPAHASSTFEGTTLGPASSLILQQEDEDGEEMTIRNVDERLSWGTNAHQHAYSMGFVHIGEILNQLMMSGEFQEERTELSSDIESQEEVFREQLDSIQEEWDELAPEAPEREDVSRRGQQIVQEFQAFQEQANRMRQEMTSAHLERAYRELVAAVNVVSDTMNIDIVFRFIPTDDEFQKSAAGGSAMQEIRMRSLLRYPEALDITSDVLEELDLDIQ